MEKVGGVAPEQKGEGAKTQEGGGDVLIQIQEGRKLLEGLKTTGIEKMVKQG